ncbi:hypothetical protein [Streptomyces sp. NPDC086182]|uniref:hypothetical protein n=1 Tax=Streptomyces sp. NPDC086182 TaxID=3155058 RepID=UPI0034276DD6
MTTEEGLGGIAVEPELQSIYTFDVRRVDSDVEGLVDRITSLLDAGVTLVDLSQHDHRGTVIELRAQPKDGNHR